MHIRYWDPSGILKSGARKAFGGASAKALKIEVGLDRALGGAFR